MSLDWKSRVVNVLSSPESQIQKGKLHGRIDVGLSVMAIKKKAKCIDLDAEENIYHLKVKNATDSNKRADLYES